MSQNYPQYQPGQPGQPGAPVQYGNPNAPVPGKTMGIVALILPFVGFGLIGMILGFVARSQSKKVGYNNVPALIAIILGALSVVVAIILIIVAIVGIQHLAEVCNQLGPGVHQQGGVQYTCS